MELETKCDMNEEAKYFHELQKLTFCKGKVKANYKTI